MSIQHAELILNPDGSIYHLNLKPEDIATEIIFVGDPDRVDKITKHFDTIEFTTQKREFKTTTGTYKNKRLSVISTGIGAGNIDIVLNELDALVNIDLEKREVKKTHTSLQIIRIGTSGSLHEDIPVDSFLLSSHALDTTGMLFAYQTEKIVQKELTNAFKKEIGLTINNIEPLVIENSNRLANKVLSKNIHQGITATANGFYGPQGRVLRLNLQDPLVNKNLDTFNHQGHRVTNLEMETAAIYGLSKLLGHEALSLNAIIANRAKGSFSKNPEEVIENLITYTLNKLAE